MDEAFDLSGKVAVITGGATGIGLGIAQGFARAGADLVIAARRIEKCEAACAVLAEYGVGTLAVQCDVSRERDVQAMIDAALSRFGRVDILVNNAGITGAAKPLLDIELTQWQKTLDTNLTGSMLCARAVAGHMAERGSGKIINIVSAGGIKPLANSADYCASKAGLLMLTDSLAIELAGKGINVNAICPGYIESDLNKDLLDKIREQAARKVPIGYMAKPDSLQGAALLLASDAGDYMVGASLVIDGGSLLTTR
ncbi:MAG: glucose 1-dehydrogenase [Pseudomonadota bacterium]